MPESARAWLAPLLLGLQGGRPALAAWQASGVSQQACEEANRQFRLENPKLDRRQLITRGIMCDGIEGLPCATELLFSHEFLWKSHDPGNGALSAPPSFVHCPGHSSHCA